MTPEEAYAAIGECKNLEPDEGGWGMTDDDLAEIGQQVEGRGIKPGYWRCRECYRPLVGAVRVWR